MAETIELPETEGSASAIKRKARLSALDEARERLKPIDAKTEWGKGYNHGMVDALAIIDKLKEKDDD